MKGECISEMTSLEIGSNQRNWVVNSLIRKTRVKETMMAPNDLRMIQQSQTEYRTPQDSVARV